MECENYIKLFGLRNRVAFITGAAGYLGRSMAEVLATAGAYVYLNDKEKDRVKALALELKNKGFGCATSSFDITDEKAVIDVFNRVDREKGKLDILVNNAYSGGSGTIESATIKDFDYSYQVIVSSAFCMIQKALPLLKEAAKYSNGGSSVINIASMYGFVSPNPSIYGNSGQNNPPEYGAAKAGLIQLTRYLACHLAPDNIRVNSISPGPFPNIDIEAQKDFYLKLCQKNPMNRIGKPHELRGPLLFFASDASSYVTGVNLPIDGGWTAW